MSDRPQQESPLPLPPWVRARKRSVPARIPLTRERIVDAAFTVLDRDGYERLSMRQVSAELGVAVSALYAHVRDKDELLELMYNRLFVGFEVPDADPSRWQEQIKEYARESRSRLLSHRDMARISMASVPFTRELLPFVERLLAIFRTAGLPDPVAAQAGDMLSTYIDGFAYEESMWEERRREAAASSWPDMRKTMEDYFTALPPDRFPHLVALSGLLTHETNDDRFERGLDIILRGLSTYLED